MMMNFACITLEHLVTNIVISIKISSLAYMVVKILVYTRSQTFYVQLYFLVKPLYLFIFTSILKKFKRCVM